MRAITVRQPWAWAIIEGWKPIENRDWPTRFRGRVGLHAAKGMTKAEYEDFYMFIREEVNSMELVAALPSFESLTRGAMLGTIQITDCVVVHSSPWFVGNYGFVMQDPKKLPEPIPCRGELGFWHMPDEIEQIILEGAQ